MLKRHEKDILKAGLNPYALEDPTSPAVQAVKIRQFRRKALVVSAFLVLALLIVDAFLAFPFFSGPSYTEYASKTIHIVGLTDEEFDISVEELGKLNCETVNAKGTSTDGGATGTGSASGYGPSLKTLMAAYGKTSDDFRRIRFLCKDGYSIALSGKKVEYDAVLSIAKGDGPLTEVQQPLRIIIPRESSGQWAYGITRIEFVSS